MHVLQDLRLGRRRVAAQQHVDVAAVLGAAALLEGFVGAAEELQQDALLNVVHLEHARRERARQQLVHGGPRRRRLDPRFLLLADLAHLLRVAGDLLRELLLDGGDVDAHAALVDLLDVEHVDVRLEEVLDGALARVDPDGVGPEDARHFDPVSGLAHVHELFVHAQRDGVRRLAVGHVVGRLLQLNHLLVGELAAIVHDLHGVSGLTGSPGTDGWLGNLAAVERYIDRMVTSGALEVSYFRLALPLLGHGSAYPSSCPE